MEAKFDGQKFITKGISDTIPLEVQHFMFAGLDLMREKAGKLDYLQVFKIETITQDGTAVLHIHHEQEVPECELDYVIPTDRDISCKIYIIDDVSHVTMLLAEEY